MLEYLTGEVLADLDDEAHRFLTRTSILPELSGELCDAVLGERGSLERLRALERTNLLVMAAGDRPQAYRNHSLLREHLLGEVDASQAARLRRRALEWSLEQGRIEAAAEYAREAAEWDTLAGLVEAHHFALLRSGRSGTLV